MDQSTESFPAQSSVLDERALLDRVVKQYSIAPPRDCRFLIRGDSDIYRITTDVGARRFLKIRRPPVSREFCEAEAALVTALANAGVRVVRPIALLHGGYSILLRCGEGDRPTLCFEEAPWPLKRAFDLEDSKQFGVLLAGVHKLADAMNLMGVDTIDPKRALAHAKTIIASPALSDDQRNLVMAAGSWAAQHSESLQSERDIGICHGDLARSNIRIDDGGRLWLFDFGHACVKSRGDELANVWHRSLPNAASESRQAHWDHLLAGYASIRNLPGRLDEFIRVHDVSARLAKLAYICGPLTLRHGVEPMEEFNLDEWLDGMRGLLD